MSGCTLALPVAGTFTDHKEVYSGTSGTNLLKGVSWIRIAGKDSKVQCRGISTITHIPAYSYILPVCYGLRGAAKLGCEDSREIDVQWEAISCDSGAGSGSDKNGNKFIFVFGGQEEADSKYITNVFGMKEEDALKYVKKEMKNAATLQNRPDQVQ